MTPEREAEIRQLLEANDAARSATNEIEGAAPGTSEDGKRSAQKPSEAPERAEEAAENA